MLIRSLRKLGYNAVGADPFIAEPVMADGRVVVAKSAIEDITHSYDVVMMHHSLEHVPDQIGTLAQVRRILAPGGTAIIRVPVIDSWAAEHFGQQWAHLDPPRHFFLHTRNSLRLAAERAGLTVREIRDDYHEFGVRGSLAVRSGFTSVVRDGLDPEQLAALLDQQRQAARTGRADMVTLFAHA